MPNAFLIVAVAHMKIWFMYRYDGNTLQNAYGVNFYLCKTVLVDMTIHIILNY